MEQTKSYAASRRRVAPLAFAVAAFMLQACSRQPQESAPQSVKESLRLAWVYDMAEAGIFVAQDQGYFYRHGLEMKVEPGGFGLDPIKLVAAGSDDFGVAGAGNLLLARAQGVPVVAIAAEFQHTPVGFIVKQASDIKSFPDFRGRRVGVQTGADTDVLYRALLKRFSIPPAAVHEVPIQYDVTPFVTGRIDVLPGYVTNQPVTLRAKRIPVRVLSAASQGLDYYGNVYFTSESMIRDHPERVKAFLTAVREGWQRAFSDRQSALDALSKRSPGLDAAEAQQIYALVMPYVQGESAQDRGLLAMEPERWETTRSVLVDAGLLKPSFELKSAYTTAFLR